MATSSAESDNGAARTICYIQIHTSDKSTFYGAAIDTNIQFASIKAVASAVNRAFGE